MKRIDPDFNYDLLGKILLVGNSAVGKSSLLFRLTDNAFEKTIPVTIGVEFGTAYFKTHRTRSADKDRSAKSNGGSQKGGDSYIVKVQIWDCAGQNKFQTIVNSYFYQADIIYFVFDLTCAQSYSDLKGWVDRADKALNGRSHIKRIIGNKLDIADNNFTGCPDPNGIYSGRIIETQMAKEYAQSIGAEYVEMSAKDSAEPFEMLLEGTLNEAYARYLKGEPLLHASANQTPHTSSSVKLYKTQNEHRKYCCTGSA